MLPAVGNAVLAEATKFVTTKSIFRRVLQLATCLHDIIKKNSDRKLAHFIALLLVISKRKFLYYYETDSYSSLYGFTLKSKIKYRVNTSRTNIA